MIIYRRWLSPWLRYQTCINLLFSILLIHAEFLLHLRNFSLRWRQPWLRRNYFQLVFLLLSVRVYWSIDPLRLNIAVRQESFFSNTFDNFIIFSYHICSCILGYPCKLSTVSLSIDWSLGPLEGLGVGIIFLMRPEVWRVKIVFWRFGRRGKARKSVLASWVDIWIFPGFEVRIIGFLLLLL